MTLSPALTRVTPGPTASTVPAPSWPRTIGVRKGIFPSMTDRSEWQTPVAPIRTSTSPSRGPSMATSVTSSGVLSSLRIAARIVSPLLPSVDQRRGGDARRPSVVRLAAGRAHHAVDEVELARHLVAGDPRPAVCGDVLDGRPAPLSRLDHGDDSLPPALVGDADDHGVVHVGVRLHCGLDLLGEDLLAARVDAGRAASQDDDRPVRVDPGKVTEDGVPDAVDDRERRRRPELVLVVAEGHVSSQGDVA